MSSGGPFLPQPCCEWAWKQTYQHPTTLFFHGITDSCKVQDRSKNSQTNNKLIFCLLGQMPHQTLAEKSFAKSLSRKTLFFYPSNCLLVCVSIISHGQKFLSPFSFSSSKRKLDSWPLVRVLQYLCSVLCQRLPVWQRLHYFIQAIIHEAPSDFNASEEF